MPHALFPDDSPSIPPATILVEIVTSLVPARPPLAHDERARVEADVACAVDAQLGAMPAGLRVAVRAAVLAFHLLPVVRWGRTFRALDDPRRQAWIRAWDEGGIGPMPTLVKLLRSCTLLAWFDHPRVVAALAADASA